MSKNKFRAWDTTTNTPRMVEWDELSYYACDMVFLNLSEVHLMQCTGLKENSYEDDSRNREIYEGDIIEGIVGRRRVVEWNDDKCKFQFSDGSDINDGENYATHKVIIGNIYENPDLIPINQ